MPSEKFPHHNFAGHFNRGKKEDITRPYFSKFGKDPAIQYHIEAGKQMAYLTQFAQEIWPTIPLETQVTPGDLILCAPNGKPNIMIWSKDLENNSVPCAIAYPVTVETVITDKSSQEITGVTYYADRLVGNETNRLEFVKTLPKSTTNSLKLTKQALAEAGYLEKMPVTVKPTDFRLLETVKTNYPGKIFTNN